MVELSFPDIGPVLIDLTVCQELHSFRQLNTEPEKAGVLIGRRAPCGAWHICRVMPPSKKSKASKFWVYRDLPTAQKFVDNAFRQSDGLDNYLGEWHTHPCSDPIPSEEDKVMISDLLKNSKMEIDFLVGLIVGQTGSACCWVQRLTEEGRIVEYPPQNFILT